jgi:signal transduction histidine kinase
MSLRARLLIAFAVVVFVPLTLLTLGFRAEATRRLSEQYERQLDITRSALDADLRRSAAAVQQQLTSLAAAVSDDNRFRAALAGVPAERQYLLDWAASSMRLTGLSILQLLDENGQILSSGHYRNEHGRNVPALVPALRNARSEVTLVRVPGIENDELALARFAPVRVGDRTLTLVGGVRVSQTFLQRLTSGNQSNADSDDAIVLSLRYGNSVLTSNGASTASPALLQSANATARREMPIPIVVVGNDGSVNVQTATLAIDQPRTYLVSLLRSVDTWFFATAAGAGLVALLLALWLSARVTRRLAALADKTAVIDLDRLDVEFDAGTDEVGRLSRVLGDLTERLHTGTARIREAERRATLGDLARQINHDIKNGLIPLRNVMRHLTQVGRNNPSALADVLTERRQTLDSSIAYLETLATNYERLSTRPQRRECDVHAVIMDVARGAGAASQIDLRMDLAPGDATVFGDPIAIRRILENLVTNAADSLDRKPGRISIRTTMRDGDDGRTLTVTVADTGRGMSAEEAARIFEHFYSTKEGGGGLGLSIVRRLVTDLHGTIRVESEPGQGTRMIVEMPMTGSRPDESRQAEQGGAQHQPRARQREGGRW